MLLGECKKILENSTLPIHKFSANLDNNRLQSRKPSYQMEKQLKHDNIFVSESWRSEWNEEVSVFGQNLQSINTKPASFDLPRKIWSCGNKVRTGHERCVNNM